MTEHKQRILILKMANRYGMSDWHKRAALILLTVNGLMSAARYCWHFRGVVKQ